MAFDAPCARPPIAPLLPMDPMDPMLPMEPIEPMLPMDPIEPIEPMLPIEPIEPMEPMLPMDPMLPIEPVEPMLPMEPLDPMEPRLPTEPTDPEASTELFRSAFATTRRGLLVGPLALLLIGSALALALIRGVLYLVGAFFERLLSLQWCHDYHAGGSLAGKESSDPSSTSSSGSMT